MKPTNPDSTFGSLKPTPPRREKYKRRAAIARLVMRIKAKKVAK